MIDLRLIDRLIATGLDFWRDDLGRWWWRWHTSRDLFSRVGHLTFSQMLLDALESYQFMQRQPD
jgi:hypothetical protein